ncbi:lamin tail domain-containing protein, partial [Erythrobacter sp.]|uniref:lamin tail domain-containing protein n=1 Tax=Erythrobacter sp. TaxID=1042 RepID=UPI00311D8B23
MVAGTESTVFFNEFHYDNASTDVGEFIEIANTDGLDLTGWTVVLYNGSGGGSYASYTLSGSDAFQTISLPSNGIQNGSPDGFALVDAAGNVVQFLSYEGSFTATDGAAVGLTSTDIGVSETTT